VVEYHRKVKPEHLRRDAYLYIRQSSLKQVYENTESTKRQYDLRQRAVALGWPLERVIVIDQDQGQSGASTDREGFQKLVTEVGMGHAGIVMGLEVSRLARNSTDWHRLIEICALSDTLILDEEGIYNPKDFNDRLLLGLKGTMSEAELHAIRARLQGGILNKSRRGELKVPLPVGLIYDLKDKVIFDPDRQVRQSIQVFFATFRRTGSARSVVKVFKKQGLKFPRRMRRGFNKGDLVWGELDSARVLEVLHNPRYAGVFAYGRTRSCKTVDGRCTVERVPMDEWLVFIENAHEGYIPLDEYKTNVKRLNENAQAQGLDRKKSPAGEGPALLQGLVVCGICGRRMTIRYHSRKNRLVPNYVCQHESVNHAERVCQDIAGAGIDEMVRELLLQALNPMAVEVALNVQKEIQARLQEADRLRKQQVERTQYEADLARQRYMQVDPANRLVADALEAEWNAKLHSLAKAHGDYQHQRQADQAMLDEKQKAQIFSLVTDFPKLWKDAKTSDRDRKRMVRLLIEDVTLSKKKNITVQIRFKGGASQTLTLPIPLSAWQARKTKDAVVKEVDRLLDSYPDDQVAEILNKQGFKSGNGHDFTRRHIMRIRMVYGLKSRYDRLRETGMLTQKEVARLLHVCTSTVNLWRRHGLLKACRYNTKMEYLYESPGGNLPVKRQGRKRV
jgi:DNA invertase Pin-like site-specific DNA recombinase/transposase InsO family protein